MISLEEIKNKIVSKIEEPDFDEKYTIDEHYMLVKCLEAISFRIREKPVLKNKMYQCPVCKRLLTMKTRENKMYSYCPKCGKALDWTDVTINVIMRK